MTALLVSDKLPQRIRTSFDVKGLSIACADLYYVGQ